MCKRVATAGLVDSFEIFRSPLQAISVLILCHLILLERYKTIYRTTDYTKSPSAVNLSFLRFTSIATTSEFCESSARNGTFR